MKRSIGLWHLWGFAVTGLCGTLLHFLYEWTGESVLVAPFSGVNESTFEHMKLLFWPLFLFAIVERFFFRERKNLWCIKLKGTLLGLTLIPVLFYTYNGVIGKSPDWINIAIFFISAMITFIYETRLFGKKDGKCAGRVAFLMLLGIGALFVLFTFKTPALGIFEDPLTGVYGIG